MMSVKVCVVLWESTLERHKLMVEKRRLHSREPSMVGIRLDSIYCVLQRLGTHINIVS